MDSYFYGKYLKILKFSVIEQKSELITYIGIAFFINAYVSWQLVTKMPSNKFWSVHFLVLAASAAGAKLER